MRRPVVFLILAFLAVALLPAARGQLRPVPLAAPDRPEPAAASASDEDPPAADSGRFHDPANPDSHKLQRAEQAFRGLPLDKRGRPDWVRALQEGRIAPRADLEGQGGMAVLDLDIVMKDTKEMPHVRFPHKPHTQWLACSNCHDGLFVPKAGANPIDMTKIFRGEYCGACHDRVAFTAAAACERCHSVPHSGSKAWW